MARLRPGLPSAFCWACGGELGSSSVVVPGPAHARLSYSDSQPPCRLRPPCVALAEGGTTLGSAASSPRVQQASWGQHGDGARSEALSSRPPASSRLVGIDQFTGRRSESLIHSQLAKPSKHAGTRRPEEEMLEAGLATQPYLQDLNVVSAPCLRCGALNGEPYLLPPPLLSRLPRRLLHPLTTRFSHHFPGLWCNQAQMSNGFRTSDAHAYESHRMQDPDRAPVVHLPAASGAGSAGGPHDVVGMSFSAGAV